MLPIIFLLIPILAYGIALPSQFISAFVLCQLSLHLLIGALELFHLILYSVIAGLHICDLLLQLPDLRVLLRALSDISRYLFLTLEIIVRDIDLQKKLLFVHRLRAEGNLLAEFLIFPFNVFRQPA